MNEHQPNPENFHPDITLGESHERPFLPVEFYTRDQLARDILESGGDTLTNPDTGYEQPRDSWEVPDELMKYYMFECRNENGTYYSLDAIKWHTGEKTNYAFADWGTTKVNIELHDTVALIPEPREADVEIKRVLLARHRQTAQGQKAAERYNQVFDLIAARLSVDEPEQPRQEYSAMQADTQPIRIQQLDFDKTKKASRNPFRRFRFFRR